MNNIKIFVSQSFETFKRDFWILIGVNLFASFLINYLFSPHEFVIFLVVSILFFKNLTFIRSSSIMPSVSSDFDRFSWKYYMGMPLNKEELVASLVLTNLIVMVPMFTAVLCFSPQLLRMFGEDLSKPEISLYAKGFMLIIAFFAYTSLASIKQQIINPRKKYSKISPKILFLQRLKVFLLISVFIGYGIVALENLGDHYTFNLAPYFKWAGPLFRFIFKTWAIVPTAFLLVAALYFGLLKVWQNENYGYIRNNWMPKRDYPLTTACACALILPFFIIDFSMPELYEGSDLNRAVYQSNEKEVMNLISKGKNINEANKHGMTPMMVAIHEGNLTFVRKLEKLGAVYTGKVIGRNEQYHYNGMNALHLAVLSRQYFMVNLLKDKMSSLAFERDAKGNLPIHVAAKECHVEVLDAILPVYKDINVTNDSGRTALHMAVRAHCFPSVDLLVSQNIDINIKDNENKLAYEYKEDWHPSRNEQFMLDKKLRAPASVKK
jgi:hypothetical protein